jgi:hypothetical protein
MPFMRPKIGMGNLPPPPVNKQVTPMVELIQQKEYDKVTCRNYKCEKKHPIKKRKPAGKVGVSAELELDPIHITTIKQLVCEADETRPEPNAKVQAGFFSL